MKETPIPFNGDMVRAILDNRKTQTRRPIDENKYFYLVPSYLDGPLERRPCNHSWTGKRIGATCQECYERLLSLCPFGQPGDRLWVRESLGLFSSPDKEMACYCADNSPAFSGWPWKRPLLSARFMPKGAARIWLEIDEIGVERLQDISEEDAKAEGVPSSSEYPMSPVYCPTCKGYGLIGAVGENLGFMEMECKQCDTYRKRFLNLFDSLYAKRGYGTEINPWVWAIKFHRIL